MGAKLSFKSLKCSPLCSYPEKKMAKWANIANNKVMYPFSHRCTHSGVGCSSLCSYPEKKMAKWANIENNYEFYEKCYQRLYKQVKLLSPLHAALLRLQVSTEVTFVCLIVAVRTLFHFAWLKPTPFLFSLSIFRKRPLY